jgi:CRP/FNR family transcriptional regulator, cyclic AMP receptor protein
MARSRMLRARNQEEVGSETAPDEAAASDIELLEFVGTCFDGVPASALSRLLVRSRRHEVGPGEPVFPPVDQAQRVGLILMGTARTFLTAADGRQLTVRYARRGAIVGRQATIVGAHPPLGVQALTDCTVLEFDVDVFVSCVATELSISRALNVELALRFEDVFATIGDSAFGSVRQRLIRHLLALANDPDSTPTYRVSITQQRLADTIGSSREVVARELGRLRDDGLILTEGGGIELLNVDRLVSSLNSWQAESPY